MSDPRPATIVLCPLRFEAAVLRRCGVTDVEVCGPGAAGIRRWARDRTPPRGATIVLVGTAGSLDADFPAGSAWFARAIVDPAGRRHTPPVPPPGAPSAVLLSVGAPMLDPAARRQARIEHGADLVDLEGVAFAEAAATGAWPWAVIRGVSDDPASNVPEGVDRWIDGRGSVRLRAVLAHAARRPFEMRHLVGLRRDATRALRASAALLARRT